MRKNQDRPADAAELRRRAEERLRAKRKSQKAEGGDQLAAEDPARLVHELQVHQIELEMQNEEVRQARAQADALLAQYTDLYDFAPVGYFTLARDGTISRVNLAGADLIGIDRSKMVKRRFGVFVSIESRPAFSGFLEKVFSTSGSKETCEVALLKDGADPLWVHMEASIDDQQECHAIVMDITERKRTEAESVRLTMAIKQVGDAVIVTDPEGTIQYVNPAFETVTGYTCEEAIGQNPRMLKSGKQDSTFYRNLWETIAFGLIWQGRMVNKHKDGALYTEEATISPVKNGSGQIVNYVAVIRDITEQLRLAAQLRQAQKMESVGRLAGGVAHDYNNMLSVIIGYTELAMDKVDQSDPLHADLNAIFNAAQRSIEITRQLLAYARKQTIQPAVLDMNETVEGMLKILRRLIGEDIDLAWLPEKGLWPVKMDSTQVDQILANLFVNARDAITGVGKITIETHMVALDEAYCADHTGFVPGEFVLLAVSDTGCGMDKEILNIIFEPFFTTKDANQGTGLGLATVYGIVKQNNGFINVYSEPGNGTTFKIYLPRHKGEAGKIREETVAEIPSSRGETVLLVEDEPEIMKMSRRMLEKLGYQVLATGTPSEAVRLARELAGKIHLLITDVVMPKMNGRDLADQLHAIYPDIKTLFMSGYTAAVIAHRGVLEGGMHFIQKPFSIKDLSLKVRATLDQK